MLKLLSVEVYDTFVLNVYDISCDDSIRYIFLMLFDVFYIDGIRYICIMGIRDLHYCGCSKFLTWRVCEILNVAGIRNLLHGLYTKSLSLQV